MTNQAPVVPPSAAAPPLPTTASVSAERRLAPTTFLAGGRGALALAGGLAGVALVGVLDHATGSSFSFSLLYLIPVAACAWWCGIPAWAFRRSIWAVCSSPSSNLIPPPPAATAAPAWAWLSPSTWPG